MANKKIKKKRAKAKKTTAQKARSAKKKAPRKKPAANKPVPKKKLAKKKSRLKKAGTKTGPIGKTASRAKISLKKPVPVRNPDLDANVSVFPGFRSRSTSHSPDLQGLSNVAGADSESVEELVEEGNSFEADVVSGVEDADDADAKEVHTHQVPEDDVPGEYLDKD
jgi:hypothetical protein